MHILLFAVAIVIFAVSFHIPVANAIDEKTFSEWESAAKTVIEERIQRLKIEAGKEEFRWLRELGFESPDQLSKLTIGRSFPLYFVRLDRLKDYKKGTDPWQLLSQTSVSIYPLEADGQVLSSVTVSLTIDQTKTKKVALVTEMGDRDLIRRLNEARELKGCISPSQCFAVAIPALGLHLFGYRPENAGEIQFVTLNRVRGHVNKDDFRNSKELLAELSNEAKHYQDGPPGHRPKKEKEWVPKQSREGGKDVITY
jgi:hypothetical protein